MSFSLKKSKHSLVQPETSYMSCVLQVSADGPGWGKTIAKILGSMDEVVNFSMGELGKVYVSAKVTPTLLLKALAKAGKKADVLWWQFGECSSNLVMPLDNPYHPMYVQHGFGTTAGYGRDYQHGYGRDYQHGYGHRPFHGYGGGYYDAYGGNNYYHSGY